MAGTPQGGVISPILSNIFLHYVLDEWFEKAAKPRLRGRCQLVRFADDFVVALEDRHSGKRLLDVLGKRLGRYGLTLHETKTRYVDFRRGRPSGRRRMASATTFDFLGFTHVWARSRKGNNVVRQITAKVLAGSVGNASPVEREREWQHATGTAPETSPSERSIHAVRGSAMNRMGFGQSGT